MDSVKTALLPAMLCEETRPYHSARGLLAPLYATTAALVAVTPVARHPVLRAPVRTLVRIHLAAPAAFTFSATAAV
jgi:hypothetical protein